MARDFSELNKYAKREYKFVQADSYRLITQDIQREVLAQSMGGGVCMGATLKWINEKLSSSNSYIKSDGRLRGAMQREFSNPLNPVSRAMAGLSVPRNSALGKVVTSTPFLSQSLKGRSAARNEGTMRRAAAVQSDYMDDTLDYSREGMNFVRINYAPQPVEVGIPERRDRTRMFEHFENIQMASNRGYRPSDHRRLEPDTIARAAFNLPTGVAILIELDNADGGFGHAIAFYRSRPGEMGRGGKTLYFFDSNAGVYKIANDAEANIKVFIEAWLRTYINYVKPITFQTTGTNWCTAFTRRPHHYQYRGI